ncbi:unnamed protein product [Diamesa serratosioi]
MTEQNIVKILDIVEPWELITDIINKTRTDESFFVFDVSDVIKKFVLWYELMPRIKPFFAFKSNNNPILVSTLATLGTGFDCASRGEFEKVLALSVSPENIVFAQTVKPVSHINFAKDAKIPLMTFDNIEELSKVKKHFPGAQLLLRLRFDPKSSNTIGFGEKFGCLPGEDAQLLMRKAKELDLNIKGIAFHIGVGCLEYDIFEKAIRDSADMFKYGKNLGFNMDLLDIGGGFPGKEIETIIGVSKVINKALDKYFPDLSIKVISEPGSFFSEKCFTLATNVHSKNVKIDVNGEKVYHYYITDGIYQSFVLNALHGVPNEIKTLKKYEGNTLKKSIIWGRACDPHDIVAKDVFLPEMEIGDWLWKCIQLKWKHSNIPKFTVDWLVLENSNDYRTTLTSCFNGFT